MHISAFIFCFASILQVVSSAEPPQPKRRNRNKPNEPSSLKVDPFPEPAAVVSDQAYPTLIPNVGNILANSRYRSLSDCPSCWASKRNTLQVAIDSYWQNDLNTAFACACNQLSINPQDGYAQAMIYSLTQATTSPFSVVDKVAPPTSPAPPTRRWELLGPINVGKLEHDSDSTFQTSTVRNLIDKGVFDPAEFILSTFYNGSVHSDLVAGGKAKWVTAKGNEQGEVEVRFPSVKWNELIQSVSSMAVYEFQGWARSVSYVKSPGSYVVSCSGTHTVYVRNNNVTHVLTGDVYRGGKILSSVDLRIGLVGIVLPLRGMGQTSFRCHLEPATNSIAVLPPVNVPELLEFPEIPNKGYLLTSVFALPVQNLQSTSLTVEFTVEKPMGQEGDYFVREARPLRDRQQDDSAAAGADPGYVGELSVAPGQTILFSLELLPVLTDSLPFISCRKNKFFTVSVIPSRGHIVKVSLEFKCRKLDQSFLISYLDHDHSVAQAAVVFPPEYHNDHFRSQEISSTVDGNGESDSEASHIAKSYPVLLTTHGSGISASSHADAHKRIPSGHTNYVFGVENFIVLAPSRFGAHNWEATGELSARQALYALRTILQRTLLLKLAPKTTGQKVPAPRSMLPLPQVALGSGIVSGHSMGAHGAWMLAINSPDLFTCLAPLSGWINKEEYGTANAFFHLDSSSAFVEPQLKELLESAMSDNHVDKMMQNVQGMDVHVRVGGADATTHPWYSRRMHRLLVQLGVNSTYEEVPGKEHWWWDTDTSNDGGVINDDRMRAFYAHCGKKTRVVEESPVELNTLSLTDTVPESLLGRASISKEVDTTYGRHNFQNSHRCAHRNVSLTVINPATNFGLCGLRVLQQKRMMSRTSVDLKCEPPQTGSLLSSPDHGQSSLSVKNCKMTTRNMRKLQITFGQRRALLGGERLSVDGVIFDLSALFSARNATSVVLKLCWDEDVRGSVQECVEGTTAGSSGDPVAEKALVNYGPIRHIYSRPFCIVYGTPQSHALRTALRNFAVYLANAHAAAYNTHVRVFSDLEYQSSRQASRKDLANVIFVGGSSTNKAMAAACGDGNKLAAGYGKGDAGRSQLLGRLPHGVKFSSEINSATGRHFEYSFELDATAYSARDQSVIFTLPIYRPPKQELSHHSRASAGAQQMVASAEVAMAVCIHANSAQGYLHMSRLAWPVVPPMVRAPFSTYMPDFMVLDGHLWSLGMGAVLKAGYWDNEWRPAKEQTFTNDFPSFL